MKIVKIAIAALFALALAFGVLMIFKGKRSRSMKPEVGMVDGRLKACGEKPNCVSSFAEQGTDFYYPPIEADNIEVIWDNLNILVGDLGFKVQFSNQKYIHCTAKTKLMGFIDDIEFLLDIEAGKIYVRSASRVGYSDLGKNRSRLDDIVNQLMK